MAEPRLIRAAEDTDWSVRKDAAEQLGRGKDPASRAALQRLLQDSNTAVIDAATEALVDGYGIDGLQIALQSLDSPDHELGDNLLALLRMYEGSGRAPVIAWLRELYESADADTRRRSRETLGWFGVTPG